MDRSDIVLYWIFELCKLNKFSVDQTHDCRPKKIRFFDKFGFEQERTDFFIVKPLNNIEFYGCLQCGKYHFCEKSSKDCPLINTPDSKVCLFSGSVISSTQMVVGHWNDEVIFEKESKVIYEKQKSLCIHKKRLPSLSSNMRPFNENNKNIRLSNNNNKSINNFITLKKIKQEPRTKYKSEITSGPIFASYDDDDNKDMNLDDKKEYNNFKGLDNDQTNPVYVNFNDTVDDYFKYLDDFIDDNISILQLNNNNTQSITVNNGNQQIYNNICEKNGFFNLFGDNIKNDVESILFSIDNSATIDKNYYIKMTTRIISLIYDSLFMKKKIEDYTTTKCKSIEIQSTKKLSSDNILIIAFKIADIKKLCYSLLLDCFLETFFMSLYNGLNLPIWIGDKWLYEQRKINNNGIFHKVDKKISNLVYNCLSSYNKYPYWLRNSLYNNF